MAYFFILCVGFFICVVTCGNERILLYKSLNKWTHMFVNFIEQAPTYDEGC